MKKLIEKVKEYIGVIMVLAILAGATMVSYCCLVQSRKAANEAVYNVSVKAEISLPQ